MALITAAAALATLTAAGRVAVQRPAPAGTCRTLRYRVDGQPVNLGRLREMAREVMGAPAPELPARVADRLAAAGPDPTPAAPAPRPALPGETLPPAPAPRQGPGVTLPDLRGDAAAGRPVSLSALARAIADDRAAARAAHPGPVGLPWEPGTPEARARVALQGERVAILWPIARALTGEGVTLPESWASDGPVMAGELTLADALARLPLGAIARAAAALAALPPVTRAQDDALSLCGTGAVPGRPYL